MGANDGAYQSDEAANLTGMTLDDKHSSDFHYNGIGYVYFKNHDDSSVMSHTRYTYM